MHAIAQDVVHGLVARDPVKRGTRFQVFQRLHDRRPGQGLGTRVAARRRSGGETLLAGPATDADPPPGRPHTTPGTRRLRPLPTAGASTFWRKRPSGNE